MGKSCVARRANGNPNGIALERQAWLRHADAQQEDIETATPGDDSKAAEFLIHSQPLDFGQNASN